jgi:hypothetical protein
MEMHRGHGADRCHLLEDHHALVGLAVPQLEGAKFKVSVLFTIAPGFFDRIRGYRRVIICRNFQECDIREWSVV